MYMSSNSNFYKWTHVFYNSLLEYNILMHSHVVYYVDQGEIRQLKPLCPSSSIHHAYFPEIIVGFCQNQRVAQSILRIRGEKVYQPLVRVNIMFVFFKIKYWEWDGFILSARIRVYWWTCTLSVLEIFVSFMPKCTLCTVQITCTE